MELIATPAVMALLVVNELTLGDKRRWLSYWFYPALNFTFCWFAYVVITVVLKILAEGV